jgi:predicted DNA-binding transcriptional regulator AlpA
MNETDQNDKELITTAEVAKMLGVSKSTIKNYRNQRLIPFIEFNDSKTKSLVRYRRSDVEAVLQKHTVTAAA